MLLPLNVLAEAILAPLPGVFQPKLAVSIHPNFPNASGKPNGVGGIGFLFQYKVATYSLLNYPPPTEQNSAFWEVGHVLVLFASNGVYPPFWLMDA